MKFLDFAKERYSVRSFSDTPVAQEKIDAILEAAMIAPTAANQQPQRIIVVQGEEMTAKFDLCSPCRYGAPLVFVVCYESENVIKRVDGGESSGQVDAAIVTTHMMLEAHEQELNTVWVMMFDANKLREEFNIPESIVPVAALITGYKTDDAAPHPFHTSSKPLSELLI